MKRLWLALAMAAISGGCAQLASRHAGALPPCETLYRAVDSAVEGAGVRDGEAARIAGFAYLRSDRLLASFAEQAHDGAPLDHWTGRLRELDRAARQAELANLPAAEYRRLAAQTGASEPLETVLDRCAVDLARRDLSKPEMREALRSRARVPDDYDSWKRIAGLYWLARIPFAAGVRAYQRETQASFDMPLEQLPLQGTLVTYAPPEPAPSSAAARAAMRDMPRDALGIPVPSQAHLETLFAAYAPVWVVDERDGNDRIGRLIVQVHGGVAVDVSAPTAYRRAAYTRYGDRVLLQLVYSVWFPARPKRAGSDLLGGHLDALMWRVTLSPGGEPLLFDSIHACGCYHQFFPTHRAQPRPAPRTLDEWAFAPQHVQLRAGERVALRIESGTHYLQRVSAWAGDGAAIRYALEDDASLRSLAHPAGDRRSVFRPDGIVAGSQRGERYLFWPMGIREAGAMRQWGRHATAFIGRRHFDEARLMERYFALQLE